MSDDKKAATITVFLDEGPPETHRLESDRDWGIIFEDVLEIKAEDRTHFYPLVSVRKWILQP